MTAFLKSALNSALPVSTAISMLKKMPGPVSNFIEGAIASGYAADKIVNTLRDRFTSPAEKEEKGRLKQREGEGTLTSEERLRLQKREEGDIGSAIKPLAALAGGAAAAAFSPPGASTAAGLVSSLGGGSKAAQEPQSKGQGLNPPQDVQSTGNPIKDLFPNLAVKVEESIQEQGNPLAAGKILKSRGNDVVSIGVLERRTDMKFPDLVASIYGQQQAQQQPQEQAQQQQQPSGSDQGLMEILSRLENIFGG